MPHQNVRTKHPTVQPPTGNQTVLWLVPLLKQTVHCSVVSVHQEPVPQVTMVSVPTKVKVMLQERRGMMVVTTSASVKMETQDNTSVTTGKEYC